MPILALLALAAIGAALLYEASKAAATSASASGTGGGSGGTTGGTANDSGGVTGTIEGLFVSKPTDAQKIFAQAIAFAEGGIDAQGNVTTNLPGRINNPGDLEIGDVGNGVQAGKTIFSAADPSSDISNSADDGWARLYHQVWIIAAGKSHFTLNMSFNDFAAFYVNGAVNKPTKDSADWANNVTSFLTSNGYSVSSGSQLGDILNA